MEVSNSYYLPDFYDVTSLGIPGDVAFYLEEARSVRPPVLELGCGTGRVLIPLAEAGIPVMGVDLSCAMLARARQKIARLSPEVQERIELVEADMRDFQLEQRFELILVPYRAFQHLLSPEDQRRALLTIRKHLTPGGRLILDLFDPRLDLLAKGLQSESSPPTLRREFTHPVTGRRVLLWTSGRIDPVDQRLYELWIYEEVDEAGKCIQRQTRSLELRWSYRYEMQYLLELCGYRVLQLYGDFQRAPYRHGGEQIWIVQNPPPG